MTLWSARPVRRAPAEAGEGVMREAEAAAVIRDAIDYILWIRESSGADDGELNLVKNFEEVIEFIRSREAKKGRGVRQVQ